MTRILICGQFAFMGAILLLLPNMTRRSLLFAVPVAEDFRNTAEARQALVSLGGGGGDCAGVGGARDDWDGHGECGGPVRAAGGYGRELLQSQPADCAIRGEERWHAKRGAERCAGTAAAVCVAGGRAVELRNSTEPRDGRHNRPYARSRAA
jgi:hypothetical protein